MWAKNVLPCVTVCCFVDTERVTVLFCQQDKDRATQSKRQCVILWTQNVLLSCFVNKTQNLLHRVRDGVLFCGHRTCYCLVLSTRDGQCYLETVCCFVDTERVTVLFCPYEMDSAT